MYLHLLATTLVVACTSAVPYTISLDSTDNLIGISNLDDASDLNGTDSCTFGNPNATANPVANDSLVPSLLTADSTVTRFQLLQDAVSNGTASNKYDYNPAANPVQNRTQDYNCSGEVIVADRVNFPMVTRLDIAGAVSYFAPCALNTLHTHPRASEIFTVATNSTINVGFTLEDGLNQDINTTLTQYQGTVFPQGSIFWQHNIGCDQAVAIGGLNSEDPGTNSLAQNSTINGNGDVGDNYRVYVEQVTAENYAFYKPNLSPPFIASLEECFRTCGLNVTGAGV